jgi:amidase
LSRPLHTHPATELAALIRRREVSSTEVVAAHLEHIAEVNGELNAVVQLASDALDRARAADAALAAKSTVGALHGVPFTVKDWIETEGLICAAGLEERRDYRPMKDAVVVARMRAAGAILLGKTNVTQGRPVYARPNNPHDRTRTPGSSSSGEAAIVAVCGSPLGIASDSGGSIRWPAHCCGVMGFKPTTGRVPLTGHFPRIGHLSDPRTVIGPIARTADDLWLALECIAGEHPSDPSAVPVPLRRPDPTQLGGARLATYTSMPGATVTLETERAVQLAAEMLRESGAVVHAATPPRLDEALPITRAYWARRRSMSLRDWRPVGDPRIDEEQIERSVFEWERFARSMSEFMRDYDLLLMPAAPRPAPLHDAWNESEYLYTLPFSLTGQPAVVVPVARSAEGLPIGVQIVAAKWRDDLVIAAARVLEGVELPFRG